MGKEGGLFVWLGKRFMLNSDWSEIEIGIEPESWGEGGGRGGG